MQTCIFLLPPFALHPYRGFQTVPHPLRTLSGGFGGERQAQTVSFCARRVSPDRRLIPPPPVSRLDPFGGPPFSQPARQKSKEAEKKRKKGKSSASMLSELHKSGHMTTGHRLFCKEFLRFNTLPCRRMPLLAHFWCYHAVVLLEWDDNSCRHGVQCSGGESPTASYVRTEMRSTHL